MPSVFDIKKLVKKLGPEEKAIFDRMFGVKIEKGELEIPKRMQKWVRSTFGSVSKVKKQGILRIDNKITGESSLYNSLRASRPLVEDKSTDVREEIENNEGGPFCKPKDMTPKDVFGRVKGKHSITASNIAKYDKWHGLIVFDKHNPLDFKKDHVQSHIETAEKWFKKAHKEDDNAVYPFIVWHCLWKSAASIIHGHMQLLLSTESHYGSVENLNKARTDYAKEYGTDYFDDLYKVHKALGLAKEKKGVRIISSLTPKKEKEIIIISDTLDKNFSEYFYRAAATLRDKFNVQSFTAGIYFPPMEEIAGWEGFPVYGRIIDRGSLTQKTGDIGAMELFGGSSVVSSDPYTIIEKFK